PGGVGPGQHHGRLRLGQQRVLGEGDGGRGRRGRHGSRLRRGAGKGAEERAGHGRKRVHAVTTGGAGERSTTTLNHPNGRPVTANRPEDGNRLVSSRWGVRTRTSPPSGAGVTCPARSSRPPQGVASTSIVRSGAAKRNSRGAEPERTPRAGGTSTRSAVTAPGTRSR